MRILVTAGPTREYFDTVRFISNASSGQMGFAIAAEAAQRGHEVHLVAGPVQLEDPAGVSVRRVVTAEEMFTAATELFAMCDAAIMAAAVCDYRPARPLDKKLKKQAEALHVDLEPTPDICAHLGGIKEHRTLVGFAMEDHDHHRHAEEKLARKGCDAIVLNAVTNAGASAGRIEIFHANGTWSRPITGTKAQLAAKVVDLVESLVSQDR